MRARVDNVCLGLINGRKKSLSIRDHRRLALTDGNGAIGQARDAAGVPVPFDTWRELIITSAHCARARIEVRQRRSALVVARAILAIVVRIGFPCALSVRA
jgi:hypothetical protein